MFAIRDFGEKMSHQRSLKEWGFCLVHLLKKDMIVFRNAILGAVLVIFAMDNFFMRIDKSWDMYVIIGIGQISYLIAFYDILEKTKKGETLLCSLPAGRTCIVLSRYLSSAAIALAGHGHPAVPVVSSCCWSVQKQKNIGY